MRTPTPPETPHSGAVDPACSRISQLSCVANGFLLLHAPAFDVRLLRRLVQREHYLPSRRMTRRPSVGQQACAGSRACVELQGLGAARCCSSSPVGHPARLRWLLPGLSPSLCTGIRPPRRVWVRSVWQWQSSLSAPVWGPQSLLLCAAAGVSRARHASRIGSRELLPRLCGGAGSCIGEQGYGGRATACRVVELRPMDRRLGC